MVKNVVIISDWCYVYGGASEVAINSALELTKYYKVYFVGAISPVDNRLYAAGVEVSCLHQMDILNDSNRLRAIINGLYNYKAYKLIKGILEKLDKRDTIVHFHTWTNGLSSSLFFVTKKYNFPIVITLHDFFLYCPNGGFFNFKKNVICHKRPMSMECILSNCDSRTYPQKVWRCLRQFIQNRLIWKNKNITIIAISKLTYKMSQELIGNRTRIELIPDPISLEYKKPNILQSTGYYIYIGRLTPIKGAELFCKALSELNLHGVVLGTGYLQKELEEKYPNISFVGWKIGKEKEHYIRGAKALIFPSIGYETFGLSVAEAKTYGIPCIVPQQSAANEQIEEGKSGFKFNIGNIASLKEAIQKYEKANISQMQDNILNTFDINKYSLESHILSLKELYEHILKK